MPEVEFFVIDAGDPSVGLQGGIERIRVQFLDDTHEKVDADIVDDFKKAIADMYNMPVVTKEEFDRNLEEDGKADSAQAREWTLDEVKKLLEQGEKNMEIWKNRLGL